MACDSLSLLLGELLDKERRVQGRTYRTIPLPPVTVGRTIDGRTGRTDTYSKMADALGVKFAVALVRKPSRKTP